MTPLAVSAPFHCKLLKPATQRLADDLSGIPINDLQIPYVSNVDAAWHEVADAAQIRTRLVTQVEAPVRWSESIGLMLTKGIERFWHLGPGRANLSHVKRQARRIPMATLDNQSDLDTICAELERSAPRP